MRLHHTLMQFSTGLLAVVAAIGPAYRAVGLPANEVGKIAQEITVLIDSQSFGSGVIISHQGKTYTVLTAEHVVRNATAAYQITAPDGQQYPMSYKTVKKLTGVDLAIAQFTSDRNYRVAQMADSDTATIGSIVHTAGFPAPGRAIQDRLFQFTSGEVAGRPPKAQADGYAMIYTNVTRRGMSGGPVLNSDGRLVGIHGRAETDESSDISQGAPIKSGFNLGIPINTFLKSADGLGLKFNSKEPSTVIAAPPIAAPSATSPSSQQALPIIPNASIAPVMLMPTGRPKPIRPSSSPQSPVCAGSSC
jgi:serine protease Do